jgi:hypothetical protein
MTNMYVSELPRFKITNILVSIYGAIFSIIE